MFTGRDRFCYSQILWPNSRKEQDFIRIVELISWLFLKLVSVITNQLLVQQGGRSVRQCTVSCLLEMFKLLCSHKKNFNGVHMSWMLLCKCLWTTSDLEFLEHPNWIRLKNLLLQKTLFRCSNKLELHSFALWPPPKFYISPPMFCCSNSVGVKLSLLSYNRFSDLFRFEFQIFSPFESLTWLSSSDTLAKRNIKNWTPNENEAQMKTKLKWKLLKWKESFLRKRRSSIKLSEKLLENRPTPSEYCKEQKNIFGDAQRVCWSSKKGWTSHVWLILDLIGGRLPD